MACASGVIDGVKMIRTIIERLSRGRTIKRRLPSRFGRTPLYVSPEARLRYLKPGEGALDNNLLKIVDEHIRRDSIVWDIGANVGVFAFAAAHVAAKGSVLAVEPDIWLAQLMRKSLSLKHNRTLGIQVLPCAISDRDGVAVFLIAGRGRASNALEAALGARSDSGGVREKVTAPTLRLDTLLNYFSPPSFVKIDVEGAETLALKGANRLLSEIRPAIYIEVGGKENDEVASIFGKNCYALFDGAKPIQEQKSARSCAYNTLAVPQENIKA